MRILCGTATTKSGWAWCAAIVAWLIGAWGSASAQPVSLAERVTALEAAIAVLEQAFRSKGELKTDTTVEIKNLDLFQSVKGKLLRFQNDINVTWTPLQPSTPPRQVYSTRSATLSFSLAVGDGTADVAEPVRTLEGMAQIIEERRRPPLVLFTMGTFTFKGVVKELSVSTPIVAPDGTRHSAVVAIVLTAAGRALSAEEGREVRKK